MIQNLSQYISEVNKISVSLNLYNTTSTAWFRGQSNATWKLIPSIYRHAHLAEYERDLNRDFKLFSKTLITNHSPITEFEWLYLMQHYELSTRLLDWTESSLVALFFAVSDFTNSDNGAVWILSPRVYNLLILKTINTVPTDQSDFVKDYVLRPDKGSEIFREVEAKFPLAIRPTKNSARILAQRGMFTIHGKEKICIKEHIDKKNIKSLPVLEKIIIDGKYKKSILKDLYQSGISHSVLFPELTGISKELLIKYTEFFK